MLPWAHGLAIEDSANIREKGFLCPLGEKHAVPGTTLEKQTCGKLERAELPSSRVAN